MLPTDTDHDALVAAMAEAGQRIARKWGHPPWSDSWARTVVQAMLAVQYEADVAEEGWKALYDHAEAANKRLRDALAFYANAGTYALPIAFSPIWSDRGRNAKQAMNGGER